MFHFGLISIRVVFAFLEGDGGSIAFLTISSFLQVSNFTSPLFHSSTIFQKILLSFAYVIYIYTFSYIRRKKYRKTFYFFTTVTGINRARKFSNSVSCFKARFYRWKNAAIFPQNLSSRSRMGSAMDRLEDDRDTISGRTAPGVWIKRGGVEKPRKWNIPFGYWTEGGIYSKMRWPCQPVGNRDAFLHARVSIVPTDFRERRRGLAPNYPGYGISWEIDSRNSAMGTSSLTVVTVNSNANQFPSPVPQLAFFRILPDFARNRG